MNEFLIKRAVADAHLQTGRTVQFRDREAPPITFDFRGSLDRWLIDNPDCFPLDGATLRPLCGPEAIQETEPTDAEPDAPPFVPPAEATPGEIAQAFLRHVLADGPMASTAVEFRSLDAGIRPRTLVRAKKAIGVKSQKVGDRWQWSLPEPARMPAG